MKKMQELAAKAGHRRSLFAQYYVAALLLAGYSKFVGESWTWELLLFLLVAHVFATQHCAICELSAEVLSALDCGQQAGKS